MLAGLFHHFLLFQLSGAEIVSSALLPKASVQVFSWKSPVGFLKPLGSHLMASQRRMRWHLLKKMVDFSRKNWFLTSFIRDETHHPMPWIFCRHLLSKASSFLSLMFWWISSSHNHMLTQRLYLSWKFLILFCSL